MTQIANYYASVGVGIDRTSLTQVDRYLKTIQTKFERFNRNVAKGTTLALKADLDMKGLMKRISRLNNGRTLKIELSVSAQSLRAMQSQIRMAINGMVVSPRINPRISNPRVTGGGGGGGGGGRSSPATTRSPHSTRNISPWHNPMMLGGGLGAFMRYGAFSLPFVGGVMGLNALSNRASTLQNQDLMMDVSMGSLGGQSESAAQKKFLSDLGDRLGRTTQTMTPFYAQMLSGAKGTALEPHLQEGFASLMEFGSVMGLGDESMKGTIKAFTQMIGKQQIMAEELRGQAAEHLPPVVRMMAEAVTGGDIKALNKMMEKGELDPSKHLPLLFKAMRANAQPFMEQYFKTITFWQGKAQKSQEDWIKRFLGGGGTDAIASFYKTWNQVIQDSIPWAERLGGIFKGIVHYMNAALLAPGEIISWMKGEGGEGNFMTKLFGSNDGSTFQSIVDMFTSIGNSFKQMIDSMKIDTQSLGQVLNIVLTVVSFVAEQISNLIKLGDAYQTGGFAGVAHEARRQSVDRYYDQVARRELDMSGMDYDERDVRKVKEGYMIGWDNQFPAPTSRPDQSASSTFGTYLGKGFSEASDLWSKGQFNFSEAWRIANTDYEAQSKLPPSMMANTGEVQRIHITQDPLQVNAQVEARTDAEAIGMEIDRRVQMSNRALFDNIISNSPQTSQ